MQSFGFVDKGFLTTILLEACKNLSELQESSVFLWTFCPIGE